MNGDTSVLYVKGFPYLFKNSCKTFFKTKVQISRFTTRTNVNRILKSRLPGYRQNLAEFLVSYADVYV